MRQNKKKLSVILGIAVCVFGLTACGSTNSRVSGTPVDEATEQTLVSYGEYFAQLLQEYVDSGQEEQFESANPELADVFTPAFESFKNAESDLGTINGFIPEDEYAVLSDTEEVTINIGIDGTDHDADLQIIWPVVISNGQITNFSTDAPSSISVNVRYSMGELMGQAGLNTVLGMGTTFVVLILLAFLISLFRYIPKIQAALSKKKEEPVPEPAPAPVVEEAPEEELVDDGELVAVIAAAIAASEGHTTTDGFVVRSIRKSRRRL